MRFPIPNPQSKRILIAVLAVFAVITLVLLAASLQNLEFKPAQPFFTLPEQAEPLLDYTRVVESVTSLNVGEAILLVGGVLVLFVLLLALIPPEARKRLLKLVLRLGLTVWVILWALERVRPEGGFEIEPAGSAAGGETTPITPSIPPYSPPDIPVWVTYGVTLLILLALGALAFYLWRLFRPVRRPLRTTLAGVARTALEELSLGRDWDDTVIQCYARMSQAVNRRRGLSRKQDMTPSEFASRLEESGLPSSAVRRLTRLFEKARYGGSESSQADVQDAVRCLTAILHAVGEQP